MYIVYNIRIIQVYKTVHLYLNWCAVLKCFCNTLVLMHIFGQWHGDVWIVRLLKRHERIWFTVSDTIKNVRTETCLKEISKCWFAFRAHRADRSLIEVSKGVGAQFLCTGKSISLTWFVKSWSVWGSLSCTDGEVRLDFTSLLTVTPSARVMLGFLRGKKFWSGYLSL